MSYGEELMEEMLINYLLRDFFQYEKYSELRILAEQGIWVTKEGKSIPIQKMSSGHLRNSIALMKRNMDDYDKYATEIAEQYIKKMQAELNRRYPPVDPAFVFD